MVPALTHWEVDDSENQADSEDELMEVWGLQCKKPIVDACCKLFAVCEVERPDQQAEDMDKVLEVPRLQFKSTDGASSCMIARSTTP